MEVVTLTAKSRQFEEGVIKIMKQDGWKFIGQTWDVILFIKDKTIKVIKREWEF